MSNENLKKFIQKLIKQSEYSIEIHKDLNTIFTKMFVDFTLDNNDYTEDEYLECIEKIEEYIQFKNKYNTLGYNTCLFIENENDKYFIGIKTHKIKK